MVPWVYTPPGHRRASHGKKNEKTSSSAKREKTRDEELKAEKYPFYFACRSA